MNLGENIYRYRTKRNMSQGDLADALEVSRQSVSKWENNMAVPDLDKLIKMSRIFGITLDDLVAEEPPEADEEPVSQIPTISVPDSEASHVPVLRKHKKFWWIWGLYLVLAYILYRFLILYELTIPLVAMQAAITVYTVHYYRGTPLRLSKPAMSFLVLCGFLVYFFGIRLFTLDGWAISNILDLYEQFYLLMILFHMALTILITALVQYLKNR